MTKEEAVTQLRLGPGINEDVSDNYNNAVNMAIEALEQEDILNKIRAEIEEHVGINQNLNPDRARALCWCLDVIDMYRAESED